MRRLAAILALLLLAIQWPLWFGRGGWMRVRELQRELNAQRAANADLDARQATLAAELRGLEQGREAIEERAREDLHLMRSDEIFFEQPSGGAAAGAQPGRPGTP